MAKAIECDRCKRKDGIPRPGEIRTLPNDEVNRKWLFLFRDRDLRYDSNGIDLCPNCARAFEEFMNGVKES